MHKRNGISLIALIITIAVIIILALITVPKINDAINKAKMSQLRSDLLNIRTAYDVYTNDGADKELPVEKDGSGYKIYDRDIVPDTPLDTAVAQSGDADDTLYILDLNKLGLLNISKGLKKNGEDDIYLVAKDSHNIYYAKGINDKNGTIYHSLLQCNNYSAPRQYTSNTISATGVVDKDQGTIEAWVSVGSSLRSGVADKYVFSTYGDERYTNTIALRHTRDNKWHAIVSIDYANVSEVKVDDNLASGWHLFSLRWNASELALFIDGVKVGSAANPKLMASVPEKFNIGVGPKLNIIDNGYVTSGDNSNFTVATYDTSDYTSAPGELKVINRGWIESTKAYPVDVNRKYLISGNFKSTGTGGLSKLYYGFSTYDTKMNYIESHMAHPFEDTKTELDRDLNPGDSIVYVKSAANWHKSTDESFFKVLAIYNYEDYPAYTYTRNTYLFNDSEQGLNTVTLSAPYTGPIVPKGTKVANTHEGGYTYTACGLSIPNAATCGLSVPNTWTAYTGTIEGVESTEYYNKFRYATKYVKIIILTNFDQDSTYTTLIDDLEMKDLTETVLDTEIDDVCISNTARTDAEVLARYQANTPVFPEDANTTYRMKN